MLISFTLRTTAIALLASITTVCHAGSDDLVVGTQLSEQTLKKYANAPAVILDTREFKVIASNQVRSADTAGSTNSVTQVINERGVVGESRNAVVASLVSVDKVKQIAASLSPAPISAQYYAHLNISTLRFSSFQDAVSAHAQLQKSLPRARIDVPIEYAKPIEQ